MPQIKNLKQYKLLLDTHIWIWVMLGDPKLSPSFRKDIERAQVQEEILISPISIWELGMLVEKGRIELEMDALDWVENSLSLQGIQIADLSPKIALQSTRLPGDIHGDPADRILVATAHEMGAVLITCDKNLMRYGSDRFVNVHNPCNEVG